VIGSLPVQQKGFTLIEILLVIVIMVVLSAMVVPSFFQATGASVEGETRYMQKLLRLAAEEAQLTGKVVRCSIYRNHVTFEGVNSEGEWQALADDIFQTVLPQAPIIVRRAHLNGDAGLVYGNLKDGEKPPLARFLFWPDGRVSAGKVVLGVKGEGEGEEKTIELRSGLGGIHVLDDAP